MPLQHFDFPSLKPSSGAPSRVHKRTIKLGGLRVCVSVSLSLDVELTRYTVARTVLLRMPKELESKFLNNKLVSIKRDHVCESRMVFRKKVMNLAMQNLANNVL